METLIVIGIALVILYVVFRIFKTIIKWVLILVLAIIIFGFFTNPKESDHRKSLKETINNLPVKVREKAIKIDDYKIFSLTKVTVRGEERIVGIGAFGKIWYFNDIEERLKKKKVKDNESKEKGAFIRLYFPLPINSNPLVHSFQQKRECLSFYIDPRA